jgi:hypothetical protein
MFIMDVGYENSPWVEQGGTLGSIADETIRPREVM